MNRKTFIVLHHISLLLLITATAFKEKWMLYLFIVMASVVSTIRRRTIKKTKTEDGSFVDHHLFDAFLHEETLPEKKRQHVMQNRGKNIFSPVLHYITMKNKTVSWIIWMIFFIASLLLTLYIASVTKHIE